MAQIVHVPVMLKEVLEALDPRPGQDYLDGTVGQGGHSEAILKRTAPDGRLLAIDRDPRNLEVAARRLSPFGDRVMTVRASFRDAAEVARNALVGPFAGILLDLGFSSAHVEDASRGFSFQQDGPLDMRYDPSQELTAAVIVNGWKEEELAKLLRLYGEEPHARRIAEAIVDARREARIVTTGHLAEVVELVVRRTGRTHPATRTFQALRIAVNDELGELERALPSLVSLLAPGGRLAVISFHSLEDRFVKRFFKDQDGETLKILTKRPLTASPEEAKLNPRARSAKLRVAERT
ncbi:16S rRNA (cytosine(1402)-N(4))-methyltransferase [Candidatus Uhrbacteria bacterium RIFCSPHIGHO2_01_FULL_63_20]|uniref:Ribosomal RNA small subunit methyltransferase H n=1 Tax=Candidatus Uhrbacteria bacterium RIFCSPHIGHO2_01_FULL_63_20 TaxID=1802385 RepID=A0A1F7TKN0_9BACT|nr:MAG: 16S rRNA (cytosine(1402)-N(4))-methyltransferase [Candidatus Uhrbacteria bacterium RIFCSPHIGHO2_01_FULL_63_20]